MPSIWARSSWSWALASPDVARMLCDVQGWTTGEYAAWLEETLAASLLTIE